MSEQEAVKVEGQVEAKAEGKGKRKAAAKTEDKVKRGVVVVSFANDDQPSLLRTMAREKNMKVSTLVRAALRAYIDADPLLKDIEVNPAAYAAKAEEKPAEVPVF